MIITTSFDQFRSDIYAQIKKAYSIAVVAQDISSPSFLDLIEKEVEKGKSVHLDIADYRQFPGKIISSQYCLVLKTVTVTIRKEIHKPSIWLFGNENVVLYGADLADLFTRIDRYGPCSYEIVSLEELTQNCLTERNGFQYASDETILFNWLHFSPIKAVRKRVVFANGNAACISKGEKVKKAIANENDSIQLNTREFVSVENFKKALEAGWVTVLTNTKFSMEDGVYLRHIGDQNYDFVQNSFPIVNSENEVELEDGTVFTYSKTGKHPFVSFGGREYVSAEFELDEKIRLVRVSTIKAPAITVANKNFDENMSSLELEKQSIAVLQKPTKSMVSENEGFYTLLFFVLILVAFILGGSLIVGALNGKTGLGLKKGLEWSGSLLKLVLLLGVLILIFITGSAKSTTTKP